MASAGAGSDFTGHGYPSLLKFKAHDLSDSVPSLVRLYVLDDFSPEHRINRGGRLKQTAQN